MKFYTYHYINIGLFFVSNFNIFLEYFWKSNEIIKQCMKYDIYKLTIY